MFGGNGGVKCYPPSWHVRYVYHVLFFPCAASPSCATMTFLSLNLNYSTCFYNDCTTLLSSASKSVSLRHFLVSTSCRHKLFCDKLEGFPFFKQPKRIGSDVYPVDIND